MACFNRDTYLRLFSSAGRRGALTIIFGMNNDSSTNAAVKISLAMGYFVKRNVRYLFEPSLQLFVLLLQRGELLLGLHALLSKLVHAVH